MNDTDRRLLDAVVDQGYLTRVQVEALVAGHKGSIADLLIEKGVLSRDTVQLMAGQAPVTAVKSKAVEAGRIGKYTVIAEIGRGGMGAVYKAWQEDLKRHVAIKVLTTLDPTAVERFQREAQMASQIRHPGIVAVYEYGLHDGKPFIVMDLLAGQPLDALLKKKKLSTRIAVEIVAAAADALAAAHQKQIIHRDIKPSNIIVELGNVPKVALTDFGLAKPVNVKDNLTQSGTILGTPHYMSPEQARGDARLEARSDVYSLGAVLYELITGKPVVEAPQVYEMLSKIISEEPVAPRKIDPKLPQDLETVVLKCLEKDARRRYANAGELAEDLRAFLEHRAVSAVPVGGVTKSVRWVKGRPWLMAACAALLAAALGLTLFVALRSGRQETEALRGELADLQTKLANAKTAEERAAVEREIAAAKEKIEKRAPEVKPPVPVESAAQIAFEALKVAILKSPGAFRANAAAIDAFLAAHGNAPEAIGAERLATELEGLRAAETLKALLAIGTTVRRLCADRKYGSALAAIVLSPELEATAQLDQIRAEVEGWAAAAWEQLVARAKGSRNAAEILKEAEAFELPEYAQKAREAIAALATVPEPPPPRLTAAIVAALLAEDFAKARELAAPDPALAKLLAAFAEFEARALEGFASRAGEKATLVMASGASVKVLIGGVKNSAVVVTDLEYNAETAHKLKEFAIAEVIAMAKRGGLDAAALALAQLLWGDRASGRSELESAGFGELAAAVALERVERVALAALDQLRKARDPAKIRELLAVVEGELASTNAVKAARGEIEQFHYALELRGIDVPALLHATVERAAGPAALHLEYGFAESESPDFLIEATMMGDLHTEGIEFRRTPDGFRLINARLAIGPPVRGETSFEVRLIPENIVTSSVQLWLPPLMLTWLPQGGSVVVTDSRRQGQNVLLLFAPAVKAGQEAVLKIAMRRDILSVSVPGAEKTGPIQPLTEATQLRVQMWTNQKALLKRVTIDGVVDPAWAKKAASAPREPKGAAAIALFNGRSMQGWRGESIEKVWRVEGGLLRADSAEAESQPILQERKFRNGRLSFEYRFDRGRVLRVFGRFLVDAHAEFQLPTTEVGVWRKAELVMIEDRSWALIDGVPVKAELRTGTIVPGAIGFQAGKYASVAIRDVRFAPFESPPLMKSWTDLLTPEMEAWKVLSPANLWNAEKGLLAAKTGFSMRSIQPFETGEVQFKARVEAAGEATFSVRYNGERVSTDLKLPPDGKFHEVVITMRGDEVRATVDGKAVVLRHRSGNSAASDGNLLLDVGAGRCEIKEFRVRQ